MPTSIEQDKAENDIIEKYIELCIKLNFHEEIASAIGIRRKIRHRLVNKKIMEVKNG